MARNLIRKAPAPAAGFEAMLRGFSESPLTADLRKSMTSAVADYRNTQEQIDRIAGDTTLTDGAKLVRQATVARAKMDTALAALEKARTRTEAGRKAVDTEIGKHLEFSSTTDFSLAAETRQYLRGLDDDKRAKFVEQAASGYDLPAMKAMAAAPPFLSGLADREAEMVRERYLGAVAPDHVASRNVLRDAEQLAENLHRQLSESVSNLLDYESADAVSKNAAA